MDKRQLDAKERILTAARKLFAEQGYEGTTVRDICEEAGVNVSLVSYHFGGKEKVLYALFESYFCLRINEREQGDEWKDPVAGLAYMIREIVSFRANNPELVKILHQEIELETPRSAELRRFVLPIWTKLRELLDRGRQQGLFHFPSLDAAMLFVMGCLLFPKPNSFVAPLLTEGQLLSHQWAEYTLRFVLGGLGCHQQEKINL
jgi:AcrR family transcriptional regulator